MGWRVTRGAGVREEKKDALQVERPLAEEESRRLWKLEKVNRCVLPWGFQKQHSPANS